MAQVGLDSLHPDAPVTLKIRHYALVAEKESGDPFDVETATYVPLGATDAELAESWQSRFLSRFFAVSGLSKRRFQQAKDMLAIDQAELEGTLILRATFPFMGATEWHEWDGTPGGALEVADDMGERLGVDVGHDQAYGPTGWEPEFDGGA